MLPTLKELLHWPDGQSPYARQEECHQVSSKERIFALLMEQRCGKTIVVLGTAAYQYQRFLEAGGFGKRAASSGNKPPSPEPEGVRDLLPSRFMKGQPGKRAGTFKEPRLDDLPKKPSQPGFIYRPKHWATKGLDALVVVALPSGVPANWSDEIDVRVPKAMNAKVMVWNARRADGAEYAERFKDLLEHEGLACFLINGEAINTDVAKKAMGTFLRCRRALVVGDETSLICSQPGNVRSKVMEAIKHLPGSVARRILDGTPGDESPLDLYSQVGFLDYKILGFDSWIAFKKYYAEWEEKSVYVAGEERKFQGMVVDEQGRKQYRNLDEMGRRLAPVSFRVRRRDVFDIPDKVRVPYHFDLSAAQRAVYDPLREEFEAWLADGEKVTAKHVLARMTRLDQVSSNFWPPQVVPTICGDCGGEGCAACNDVGAILSKSPKKIIDTKQNTRLVALADVLTVNKEPGIVWAVFDETIDAIMALGEKLGRSPIRYDGKVDDVAKAEAKRSFQGGHSGLFVSKEASGGRGINLSAAKFMVYVENGYSKRKRSQSEDRAEVAGRYQGTGIIDLIADDTYDQKKLDAHFAKGEVAETLWMALAAGRASQ